MDRSTPRVNKIAALCGVIWFSFNIDASFSWFFPDVVRYCIGAFFIIIATSVIIRDNKLTLKSSARLLFFSVFLLALYMVFIGSSIIIVFFKLFPLLIVILWPTSELHFFYFYLKKFIVFYAILSVFVEILVVSKLWSYLPCLTVFPPQDYVQEHQGLVNYFYGFFCIPAVDHSLSFYRACGPLREGGHFVFFIGFFYFVEEVIYNRRNIWLFVCGLLTLSPNFLIILLLTEGYMAINKKRYKKVLLSLTSAISCFFLLWFILPQSIKDEIIYIIFERSLESSMENADSNVIMSLLDGRVGDIGILKYESFQSSGMRVKLFGVNDLDFDGLMSDFRCLLMWYGYVGTFLFLFCTFLFSLGNKASSYGMCVFIIALLVFFQRAWMFNDIYIWVMMFLSLNEKKINSIYYGN